MTKRGAHLSYYPRALQNDYRYPKVGYALVEDTLQHNKANYQNPYDS